MDFYDSLKERLQSRSKKQLIDSYIELYKRCSVYKSTIDIFYRPDFDFETACERNHCDKIDEVKRNVHGIQKYITNRLADILFKGE